MSAAFRAGVIPLFDTHVFRALHTPGGGRLVDDFQCAAFRQGVFTHQVVTEQQRIRIDMGQAADFHPHGFHLAVLLGQGLVFEDLNNAFTEGHFMHDAGLPVDR